MRKDGAAWPLVTHHVAITGRLRVMSDIERARGYGGVAFPGRQSHC